MTIQAAFHKFLPCLIVCLPPVVVSTLPLGPSSRLLSKVFEIATSLAKLALARALGGVNAVGIVPRSCPRPSINPSPKLDVYACM